MSTPTGTDAGTATAAPAAGVPAPREDQDEAPVEARTGRLAPFVPDRRQAMFLLGGLLGGALVSGGAVAYKLRDPSPYVRDDEDGISTRTALNKLRAGNERFSTGTPKYIDQTVERRDALAAGQAPFATVLACADSRVPPELIFDQGLGDLYVVRSLGQVVDHAVLGSLQYGVETLGTPLVVVLGHSQCGIVRATVEALKKKSKPTGTDIDALVAAITPAVHEAEEVGAKESNLVNVTVGLNVERTVESLQKAPTLLEAVALRKTKIVGATYSVRSGEVDWL